MRVSGQGRGREIAAAHGISLPAGRKHGPCPVCGGRDRFQYDKEFEGRWICRHGENHADGRLSGDIFDLVRLVNNWDAMQLLVQMEDYFQLNPAATDFVPVASPAAAPAAPQERDLTSFLARYEALKPHVIRASCGYLHSKGYPDFCIYQLTQLMKFDLGDSKTQYIPAGSTLLKLFNAAGEFVGLEVFSKPRLPGQKWLKMHLAGSHKRGAHFAFPDPDAVRGYVLCEGFATGYALTRFVPRARVWVACDAGNLMNVARGIREQEPDALIAIAADNDENGAGMAAALKVREQLGNVLISMPVTPGDDWDAVYRREGEAHALVLFREGLVRG